MLFRSGEYKKHDWTVKAWLDAVFIPVRLQKHLAKLGPPAYPGELYLKTTKHGVGLVPDFLVFSSNGVSAFLKHAPACKKNIAQFESDYITLAMCADAHDIGYMEDTTVMSKKDDADWAFHLRACLRSCASPEKRRGLHWAYSSAQCSLIGLSFCSMILRPRRSSAWIWVVPSDRKSVV